MGEHKNSGDAIRDESVSDDVDTTLNSLSILGDQVRSPNQPMSCIDLIKDLDFGRGFDDILNDLNVDRPILGDRAHYGLDPLTGAVKAYPSIRNDVWTKDDQDAAETIKRRGYMYGLDPVTGKVTTFPNVRNDVYTAADAERDKIIKDRGWYYGLNRSTGRVTSFRSGPVLE